MSIHGRMRIISRQIIYILVISISMIGCSSSSKINNLSNNESLTTQSSINNKDDKQLKGDLELQIFVGGYGEEFWNEAIDTFKNENPQINIIKKMGRTINDEMLPRWKSGNPPDFAYVDGPGFDEEKFVRDDLLLDLKDWIDTSKTSDGSTLIKDKIYRGFIREDGGKEYFLPYIFGTLGMWYDAKLFRDNNLPVPTNFEEFLNLAPVLKTKNIALMNYPGKYPVYVFKGLMRQNLALLGGQQSLDDVALLKPGVFLSDAFYKSMYKLEIISKTDNGVLSESFASDHIKAQKEWLQRKSAFIPNGLWLENEMKGSIPADFEMTFIPSLIQDKGQKYVICANANSLCLARKGKNVEAAKAWLNFLCREDILRRFTEITGIPTAFKMDLSETNVSERVKNVQRWIANPDIEFVYERNLDLRMDGALNSAINDVVAGKINAREACEGLQKEADKVMAINK